MLIIKAGIHQMLVRRANMEDAHQTDSSEAVWSESALFIQAFWQATSVQNFIPFNLNK